MDGLLFAVSWSWVRLLAIFYTEYSLSHFVLFFDSSKQLDQLKVILGLSDTDAEYEIAAEATPLYQATALASMKDVLSKTKTPDLDPCFGGSQPTNAHKIIVVHRYQQNAKHQPKLYYATRHIIASQFSLREQ